MFDVSSSRAWSASIKVPANFWILPVFNELAWVTRRGGIDATELVLSPRISMLNLYFCGNISRKIGAAGLTLQPKNSSEDAKEGQDG